MQKYKQFSIQQNKSQKESILNKHDKMIREDIDREIEQLREQIKML